MKNGNAFFLRHFLWLCVIGVLLSALSYAFVDIPLTRVFSQGFESLKQTAELISVIIDPYAQLLLWPFLLFWARVKRWPQNVVITLSLLLFGLAVSLVCVEVLKGILGRARPELLFSKGIFGFHFHFFEIADAYRSFPSGHACAVGACCGVISYLFPRYTLWLLLAAITLVFARVIVQAHYLSDVVAGLIVGILGAQWAAKRLSRVSF